MIAVEYMKKTLSAQLGRMCLAALYSFHAPRLPEKDSERSFLGGSLPVEFADRLFGWLLSWNAESCTCAPVKSGAWRNVAVYCSWTSCLRASPLQNQIDKVPESRGKKTTTEKEQSKGKKNKSNKQSPFGMCVLVCPAVMMRSFKPTRCSGDACSLLVARVCLPLGSARDEKCSNT